MELRDRLLTSDAETHKTTKAGLSLSSQRPKAPVDQAIRKVLLYGGTSALANSVDGLRPSARTSGSSSSTSRKCASSKTSRSWITLHSEARKRTSRTNLPAEHVQRVAAFSFDELSGSVEVSHREVEVVVFEAESAILLKVVARQPLLRGGVEGYYSKFVYTRAAPFSLRETGDA
ncbi:hypothetical protein PF008_g988 [Phytophthora fragariae]|uniref:Uncharacterized protein n=1 Tax=Phytophthora fragariae TaxID=53985 RepID=A0A6G0SLE8_9STRA|nr:hypothetical protein PF008_g988 [Phytophthora fragariae]